LSLLGRPYVQPNTLKFVFNKDESALRRPPSLWHARLLRRIATAELGTFSQRATPARCGRERSGVSRQKRRAGRRQGDQGGAAEAKRERHAAPVHPVHPAHPTHPAHPPGNRSNARGGGEGSRRAAYRSCFASAAPSPPPSLSASLCSRHRLPSLPTVIRLGEFFETGQFSRMQATRDSPLRTESKRRNSFVNHGHDHSDSCVSVAIR